MDSRVREDDLVGQEKGPLHSMRSGSLSFQLPSQSYFFCFSSTLLWRL
jgi:hypothetical protein